MSLHRLAAVAWVVVVLGVTGCRTNTTGVATPMDGGGRGGGAGSNGGPDGGGGGPDRPANMDSDAAGPTTCQRDLPQKKTNGQACGCAEECSSGTCAQGVCCGTKCDGLCQSCNNPGSPGICGPVPAGQTPAVVSQCKTDDVASCGFDGKCDGAGACRKYPEGSICAAGSCNGSAVVGAKVCSGGACVVGQATACSPYGCDSANGRCFSSCTTGAQCDARECTGGSCGKKPLGAVCASASECSSDFCADGVCCNLACSGPCVSCNQVGSMGECNAVAAGNADPHGACKMEAKETCGTNGLCNGVGGCAKYGAGTECRAGTCSSGSETPIATCDGEGTCQNAMPIPCAPFQCGATTCRATCASNADCVAPNICTNGSCGKRPNGQACTTANDCASGFCVDGFCCNNTCVGTCVTCGLATARGRCSNVPAGTVDPRGVCRDLGAAMCGTNGRCNGNKGCESYANGAVCRGASCDAATDRFTQASTCQGGRCVPPTPTSCSPFQCRGSSCANSCASNADCIAPNTCVNGSCGKKPLGQVCSSGPECASNFCADGVCCESACTGSCFSCRLSGSAGRCVPVAAGAADPKNVCRDQTPASCGNDGTCNGLGACRKYAANTVCGAASCANGTARAASTCNGNGTCVAGTTTTCSPYVCNTAGSACFSSCQSNTSCAAPNQCVNGSCGKLPNGGSCTSGAECQSNTCVDGVCCNTACTGQCQSCTLTATRGTCTTVPAGTVDPNAVCVATASTSCGNDGKCAADGTCSKWSASTPCRSASCPAAGSTLTLAANCNGTGACPAPQTQSCGVYKCDGDANVCRSSCGTSADCSTGDCVGGSCGKKDLGGTCSSGTDCHSGNCVDGRCCSTASCGSCQTCGNAQGTCANIPAGQSDSNDNTCQADAPGGCGNTGACDGSGGCLKRGADTTCGSACVGDATRPKVCNGAGACVDGTSSPVTCGNFGCDTGEGTCHTSCNGNGQCSGSNVCLLGACAPPIVPPPDPDGGM
jgi:hypothetical protein